MTRIEENEQLINILVERVPDPLFGTEKRENVRIAVLADISKSLAVIADAMTEKQEETKNE